MVPVFRSCILDQWLEQPLLSLRVLRNVSVIFQEAEIPSNDKCSGAVSIGTRLPFSYSGSTLGATPDSIEGAACAGLVSDVARGVWFRYTPPGTSSSSNNQLTTFAVVESSFITFIALYTGSCNGLVCVPLTEFVTSELAFQAEAGQTYFILLTAYFSGEVGTYNITVTVSVPPLLFVMKHSRLIMFGVPQ
jgi:hypothetical protein